MSSEGSQELECASSPPLKSVDIQQPPSFNSRTVPSPVQNDGSSDRTSRLEANTNSAIGADLAMIPTLSHSSTARFALPRILNAHQAPVEQITDVGLETEGLFGKPRMMESSTSYQRLSENGSIPKTRERTYESEATSVIERDLTELLEYLVDQATRDILCVSINEHAVDIKEISASEDNAGAEDNQGGCNRRTQGNSAQKTSEVSTSIVKAIQVSTPSVDHLQPNPSISFPRDPFTPIGEDRIDESWERMGNLTIVGINQQLPLRNMVPENYKSSLSTDPKIHFDAVAFYEAVSRQGRRSSEKRKRQTFGFNPYEVIKKGALHGTHLNITYNLTNDVHSIFDEQHWTDCPHQIYEVIRPALLLASKFLSTPQYLQHFQTVLKGDRKYCPKTSSLYRRPCYRIIDDVPLTAQSARELILRISSLVGTVSFQFLTAANKHANKFIAMAQLIPCHDSSLISSSPQTTLISLHTDFYVQAQVQCKLKYPDPAQVMRFQFFLATTLMHELAHAFEISCSPVQTSLGQEVYMYDWLEAESGRAWEASVFGGQVMTINNRCDGLHGLCVVEWPEPGLKDTELTGQSNIQTIPMDFINALFQESTWEEIGKKPVGERGMLIVPKDGATSVGLCSFTTARFEDVIREREMGAMELALKHIAEEEGLESPRMHDNNDHGKRRKRRKICIPPT